MRKEVTYYAEDNTPFKSESECKKYEEKKKKRTHHGSTDRHV